MGIRLVEMWSHCCHIWISMSARDVQKNATFLHCSGHGETSADNVMGESGGGDHLLNVGI